MAQLTFADLRERVAAAIREAGGSDREAAAATNAAVQVIAAHCDLPDAQRRIDADLFTKDTHYAIPDDTLAFLPTLAKAALSVALGSAVDGLGELIGLLYRYRTSRVELDGDEAAVLRALKTADRALAAADVEQRLRAVGVRLRRPVGQVLADLDRRRRGSTVLVRNLNGRWAIGNV